MTANGRSDSGDLDLGDVLDLGDAIASDVRDLLRVVRDCRLILLAILLLMLLGIVFGVVVVVSAGQALS